MVDYSSISIRTNGNYLGWAINDSNPARRKYDRRVCDRCVASVNDQPFLVDNWSMGGVLLRGDDRCFVDGEEVQLMLKFKLGNRIIDVKHIGHVIRKSGSKMAIKFAPLTEFLIDIFHQVISVNDAQLAPA